jgi:hypothetical protein
MRAILARVPALSLPYQFRISRMRAFISALLQNVESVGLFRLLSQLTDTRTQLTQPT